ncbi:MAG: caspase family protein [Bacteroidales bacterium]|nr:caspase family protein [Bacteroidales bacterium]
MKIESITLILCIFFNTSSSFSQNKIKLTTYTNAEFGFEINFPAPPVETKKIAGIEVITDLYGPSNFRYRFATYKSSMANFNSSMTRLAGDYRTQGYTVNKSDYMVGETKVVKLVLTGPSNIIQHCFKIDGVFYYLSIACNTNLPDYAQIAPFYYSLKLNNGFEFIKPYNFTEADLQYKLPGQQESNPPVSDNLNQQNTNEVTEQKTEMQRISEKDVEQETNVPVSEVDKNIPVTNTEKSYTYALIIGNEDYKTYQMGLSNEVNVAYATNDARIFKEYCQKTLGIPDRNITLLIDARAIDMHRAIDKLSLLAKNAQGDAELIFYYAGHGLPDEATQEPHIIPVDVSGKDLKFAVPVKDLYEKLTAYPTKKITVFLDACFSGGARDQGLVEARAVKVKPKENPLTGNLIVFSASSGEQSSLPYKDQGHGIFTYYLLKKLQETSGNITYGELANFISKEVGINSIIINEKEQNPQINVSPNIQESWKEMKIK